MHWGITFLAADRIPLTIAGLIAAEIIVILIARTSRRRDESESRWRIPFARMFAIATLFCAIPKPVITTNVTPTSGDFCVLIDFSHGMNARDAARPPARCVALADAAGMLSPSVRTREGESMKLAVRQLLKLTENVATAQSEVDYAQLSGNGLDKARGRLRDALKNLADRTAELKNQTVGHANASRLFANCGSILDQISRLQTGVPPTRGWSRLQQSVESCIGAADEPQEVADATLYRDDVSTRAAADEVLSMPRIEIVRRVVLKLQKEIEPATLSIVEASPSLNSVDLARESPLVADGAGSDINRAISRAQTLARKKGSTAILLFSDGRQVGSGRESIGSEVPVVAVNVGIRSRRDPANIATEIPESATSRPNFSVDGTNSAPRPTSSPTTEAPDSLPDEEHLRRIARASNGQYMRIDECDSLGGRLGDLARLNPRAIDYPLWDSPAIYFIVVGCLTLDWTTRKTRGLV